MLDQNKAVIGDPVPKILRQWLQAWRPCFTAPSWEHVLVLVMGSLMATGKRTVTSCLRVTGRADAANFGKRTFRSTATLPGGRPPVIDAGRYPHSCK